MNISWKMYGQEFGVTCYGVLVIDGAVEHDHVICLNGIDVAIVPAALYN
jgi:hypothetical protein